MIVLLIAVGLVLADLDVDSAIGGHLVATQRSPGLVAQLAQQCVGVIGLVNKSQPLSRHCEGVETAERPLVR